MVIVTIEACRHRLLLFPLLVSFSVYPHGGFRLDVVLSVARELTMVLSGDIGWHLSFRIVVHDSCASEHRILQALARAIVTDTRFMRAHSSQVLFLPI